MKDIAVKGSAGLRAASEAREVFKSAHYSLLRNLSVVAEAMVEGKTVELCFGQFSAARLVKPNPEMDELVTGIVGAHAAPSDEIDVLLIQFGGDEEKNMALAKDALAYTMKSPVDYVLLLEQLALEVEIYRHAKRKLELEGQLLAPPPYRYR